MTRHYRHRQSSEADYAALSSAWKAYQRERRSLWIRAPFIERRYYQTQDYAAYVAEHQQIVKDRSAAIYHWTAACRRVHRDVQVIPVGATIVGLPTCVLVRVPKARSILVDEHLFGRVALTDHEGLALVDQLRSRDTAERRAAIQRGREHELLARLTQALTEARTNAAAKDHALEMRRHVARCDPRWLVLTKRSYVHHALHRRSWAKVQGLKNRLAALGLVYDIDAIETPIVLPPS